MSKALTEQELHNLAMNHVGKDLEKRGFDFIAINSKLKRHPQFVCMDKNKQYFFVIVKVVILIIMMSFGWKPLKNTHAIKMLKFYMLVWDWETQMVKTCQSI